MQVVMGMGMGIYVNMGVVCFFATCVLKWRNEEALKLDESFTLLLLMMFLFRLGLWQGISSYYVF